MMSEQATGDGDEESLRPKSRTQYNCIQIIKENHRQQIYAVEVNNQVQYDNGILFATIGANAVQIYKFDTLTNKTQLIHAYMDPDTNEEYFACAWTLIEKVVPSEIPTVLLAAGGDRGVIRVLDIYQKCQYTALVQTGAINHIIFAKNKSRLLFTASKNFTVTLWDVISSVCLAVFHGPNGHTDQVLHRVLKDVNDQCTMMASASMDRSILIWSLTSDKIREQIDLIENCAHQTNRRLIKAYPVSFPDIEAKATTLHSHYVDNVRWYGEVLLSRSADHTFCLWQPILNTAGKGSTFQLLLKWALQEKDYIWFLKCDLSLTSQLLAIGTWNGDIHVWDLCHHMQNPALDFVKLRNPHSKAKISRVSFNYDGSILIGCSDDSRVFIWKRNSE